MKRALDVLKKQDETEWEREREATVTKWRASDHVTKSQTQNEAFLKAEDWKLLLQSYFLMLGQRVQMLLKNFFPLSCEVSHILHS